MPGHADELIPARRRLYNYRYGGWHATRGEPDAYRKYLEEQAKRPKIPGLWTAFGGGEVDISFESAPLPPLTIHSCD